MQYLIMQIFNIIYWGLIIWIYIYFWVYSFFVYLQFYFSPNIMWGFTII